MEQRSVTSHFVILLGLMAFALLIAFMLYPGLPTAGGEFASDWSLHVGKIKILMYGLPKISRWNPYWYFGCPFLRFWPPFCFSLYALVSWIFQISIEKTFTLYSFIIFVIGAFSTYLLSRELKLSEFAGFASSLLFLSSFSIHWWLGIVGHIPDITALMITPLALLTFLKAVRKHTLNSVLTCGVVFYFTILIHLNNTLIFSIFLTVTSFALIIDDPTLFFSKLRLPKVLLSSVFIATLLSSWWWIPFFSEESVFRVTESIKVSSVGGVIQPIDLFLPSKYYSGIGHLVLAFGGLLVCSKIRKIEHKLALSWFILSIIGGFAPYLNLPIGSPDRFGPYLSLSTALLGGFFLESLVEHYEKRTKKKSIALIICSVIIIISAFTPLAEAKDSINITDKLSDHPSYEWLRNNVKNGERVATDADYLAYELNIFSKVSQSAGGAENEMTNEFAYTFWYYVYYESNPNCFTYFSRNFNVKYFVLPEKIEGVKEVYPGIYEVQDFNSSFVEILGPDSLTVLFFGEKAEYTQLFELLALIGSSDIVLINGGEYLEDHSIETIKRFDVIYLDGLKYRSLPNFSELLSNYAKEGGGIILDTGNFPPEGSVSGIPAPFPVSETSSMTLSFELTEVVPNNITANVDFAKFSVGAYDASFAKTLKNGSVILLSDGGNPVLVFWKYGKGIVLWSGLRLPYHALLHQNFDEMKLLENMIRNATTDSRERSYASVSFEFPNAEEILVDVRNATSGNALWVKMSYYPGWTAYIGEESLTLFLAGPDMMMVLPDLSGDYTVKFRFEKTFEVRIGEAISVISLVALCIIIMYNLVKTRRGKKRLVKQEALGK